VTAVETRVVVVGTSWGGLAALKTLVGGLPETFRSPVIVVQHRHKDSDSVLARALQAQTGLAVLEVEDKMPITAGCVYLAPPDYHLLVDVDEFSLSTEAPVHYSRPSIDVTFFSVADAFGPQVTGVVLTGANDDGAAGLRRVADAGGRMIVQDPDEAESALMPRAALRAVPSAEVLPLQAIPAALVRLEALPTPSARDPYAQRSPTGPLA